MSADSYLANHLLIAMPALADPNFSRTVTYICEHTADGALGLVINRPMEINLGEILTHMKIEPAAAGVSDWPVFLGGPVQQERGFVLHRGATTFESSMPVTDGIYITSSRDILAAIAQGKGPPESLVALGYAGWSAGQLEQEIRDNAWLSVPADPGILFETPVDERWARAAALIGIDLNRISDTAGHA